MLVLAKNLKKICEAKTREVNGQLPDGFLQRAIGFAFFRQNDLFTPYFFARCTHVLGDDVAVNP